MAVSDRVQRLRRVLAPEFQAALVVRPIHVHYLSGHAPPDRAPSAVVVGPERCVLVSPGPAPDRGPSVDHVAYRAYGHDAPVDPTSRFEEAVRRALEQAGAAGRAIAVEEEWVPVAIGRAAAEVATTGPLGDRLERLRAIKDEDELALVRRAATIVDGAFAAVAQALRPGRTELEVYAEAERAILLAHGEPFTMECVFVSGPRTLETVGPPTARVVEPGDLLIFDVFPYLRGYKVDVTRTFVAGRATDEQRRLHDVLERALAAGAAAIRPGTTGGDVDRAARGVIEAAGLSCPHHMGHAIGLFHPERPSFVPGETERLAAGMVVTLEPGVYVPPRSGMRLEQNYVVREGEPEALSGYPMELIEAPRLSS